MLGSSRAGSHPGLAGRHAGLPHPKPALPARLVLRVALMLQPIAPVLVIPCARRFIRLFDPRRLHVHPIALRGVGLFLLAHLPPSILRPRPHCAGTRDQHAHPGQSCIRTPRVLPRLRHHTLTGIGARAKVEHGRRRDRVFVNQRVQAVLRATCLLARRR